MRYFPIFVIEGRLHQPAVVEAGVWDPRRVQYHDEAVADTILVMMTTDKKVHTLAEIYAAMGQLKSTQGWRKLWVPETLEPEVARRVTRAGK